MTMRSGPLGRRSVLKGGTAALAAVAMPSVLRAQAKPVKIGILQPVTGALAMDGDFGRTGAELAIVTLAGAWTLSCAFT